jgi:hypothetical protein
MINEVMASNGGTLEDAEGDAHDRSSCRSIGCGRCAARVFSERRCLDAGQASGARSVERAGVAGIWASGVVGERRAGEGSGASGLQAFGQWGAGGAHIARAGRTDPPVFSVPAGFYPGTLSLALTHSDPDAVIRYSVDGSVPGADLVAGKPWAYKNIYPVQDLPVSGPLIADTMRAYVYSAPLSLGRLMRRA